MKEHKCLEVYLYQDFLFRLQSIALVQPSYQQQCLVYSAMDCEVSFPIAKVYSMMNEINFSEETESEN